MMILALGIALSTAHAATCEDRLAAIADAPSGCATDALFTLWRDGDDAACATAWSARGLGPRIPTRQGLRDAPAGDKQVRDAYGEFNTLETTNFAVKWGLGGTFSEADVLAAAQALEAAWAHQVEAEGYPHPIGADTWKFNVYVGDSGGGTPSAMGNAGYYWYDDDGHPMIVLAAGILRDRTYAAGTAAHELFHAVQDAAGVFDWGRNSRWYPEATAMWIESQVFPGAGAYATFLWYFAARPELSLTYFDYPDEGIIEEYHHYGAFLFLTHLEQHHGGPSVVRRSFERGGPGADSLRVLTDVLAEDGDDLEDAFAAFVGRNATWDYADQALYLSVIDEHGGWSADSHRPTGSLIDQRAWVTPTEALPSGWGANYWILRGLHGRAVLHFDGQQDPTRQPNRWLVTVAVRDGDTHRRIPMSLEDGRGALAASALGDFDEAWLVVAAIARPDTRTFAYAVRLEAPEPDDDAAKRCGCATRRPSGPLAAVLVALALRRRRQPRRSQVAASVA